MQDIQILEQAGLTKNDRKVYLALLQLGLTSVGDLLKKTSLHRSYVYDILDKLIAAGLVSFTIKNNKKFFHAENPERILQILEDKKQKILENKEKIRKVLPELIEKRREAIEKQEARIFLGKEGVKSILEDILKVGRDFVAFGAEGKFKKIFKWYFDKWQKRRAKAGIKARIIYSAKLRGKRPTKEQKLTEVRFLSERFEFPSTIIVYGNKVAVIIWESQTVGFVLESEEATKTFLNYFELLWNKGRK